MMQTLTNRYLFFPFTHITQNDLDTILTFFPQFHCLSINRNFKKSKNLQQLFDQGKIIPYFLSPEILAPLGQKLEQFLEWARIHKGSENNLKLLLKNNPYFTNDSDVSAIKSQIRGSRKDRKDSLSDESFLQKDLLFLKMAQLYDEQKEDIDHELKDLTQTSDELVSTLRGLEDFEDEIKHTKPDNDTDSGTIMTRERIFAWFRSMHTMKLLNQEETPPLFITTNREIFYFFESNCKNIINILDIDNIKVHGNRCENQYRWQDQFENYLKSAIKGSGNLKNKLPEVNDSCSKRGQIKVCNFAGGDINKILNLPDKHISVCLIKLN
ncbi:MAG: hypothetical protein ABFR31_07785 [Thermodesulfobacteriota bacterium]